MAVYVTETSKSADSILGYESVLHKKFSPDPLAEYYHVEECILEQLSLRELSTKPPTHDVDHNTNENIRYSHYDSFVSCHEPYEQV